MTAVPATFGALLVVFLAAQSAVGYREDPEVHMDAVRTNFSASQQIVRPFGFVTGLQKSFLLRRRSILRQLAVGIAASFCVSSSSVIGRCQKGLGLV